MPLNILDFVRLCARNGRRGSGDQDEELQETTSDNGTVAPDDSDLEACRHPEVRGLIGLANRAGEDNLYMLTRRFTRQAMYCLDHKANHIVKLWKEIQLVDDKDDDRFIQVSQDLYDSMQTFYQLLITTRKVHGWPKSQRILLQNYRDSAMQESDPDQRAFIDDGGFNDWVSAFPMEPLDQFINLLPEYECLRPFIRPFLKNKTSHKGFQKLEYSSKPFHIARLVGSLIIATLVGVPVAMQALDVTSTAVNVVVYILGLFILIGFTQIIVSSQSAQYFMTLAYAAVVATNMGVGGR